MDAGDTGHSRPLHVYLVRHGETEWSLTGQHTGRTDMALTPHGEDAARSLRPSLCAVHFDGVLTSPLQRARRTCTLAGLGSAATIEPDLAEWDYGQFEGKVSKDIRRDRPGWNCYHDGCPGGESPDDISRRADRIVARLCTLRARQELNAGLYHHKAPNSLTFNEPLNSLICFRALSRNVAIFTHGEFGCSLAARWIGLPVLQGEHFQLGTASVSILAFNPSHLGLPVIAQWNVLPGVRVDANAVGPYPQPARE
jgi:broad specificity phosphatase PhoE